MFGGKMTIQNICFLCQKEVDSPVCPTILTHWFNPRKMKIEDVVSKVCQDVFCKHCLIYWMGLNDIKGISYLCPHCFKPFDSLLSIDNEIVTTFEKDLTEIRGIKFEETVRRLLKQEKLDRALEILRSIPALETTDSAISYNVSMKNGLFLELAEAYQKKENSIQALEILDKDLDFSEPEDERFAEDKDKISEFYMNVALSYAGMQKPDKALEFLDKALKQTRLVLDELIKIKLLVKISLANESIHMVDNSMEFLDEILTIAEIITGPDLYKQNAFRNALLYGFQTYVAFKMSNQALKILGKILTINLRSLTEDELAFVETFNNHIKAGRFDLSLEELHKSLNLIESILDIKDNAQAKAFFARLIEIGTT